MSENDVTLDTETYQMLQQELDTLRAAAAKALERDRAVATILNKIRQSLDLKTIFTTSTEEARQLLQADRVAIYRFQPDWSGEFVVESVAEDCIALRDEQALRPELRQNLSECSLKQLTNLGKITDTYLQENEGGEFGRGAVCRVCDDIYSAGFSDCYIEALERFQARAYAIVAIYEGERLWGLLAAFQNTGPRHWEESELGFLLQIGDQLGVAIQQTQLLAQKELHKAELQTALTAELQTRADDLADEAERERALAEVIDKIRQTLDLETIFHTAATEVRQLLKADRVGVFRFDADSGYSEGEFVAEAVLPPFDSALSAKVRDRCFAQDNATHYQQGQVLAIADIHAAGLSDCHIEILARFQVRANLVVPLLEGEELWGLLCIHHCSAPRQWQDKETEFVRKIAIQLGVALQQAKLLAQAQQRSDALQVALAQVQHQTTEQRKAAERERTLAEVIDKIRRTLDLETIFQTTATEVRQLLNADRVAVFRFIPDSGWTEGEFVSEDVLPEFTPAMTARVRDRCFGDKHATYYQQGRIWAADDIAKAGLLDCHLAVLAPFQVKANLVAPLLKGEELWGLLCIHHCTVPRRWQASEIEFAKKIALHLGVALRQADLLAQAEKRSAELQIALAQVQAQQEHQTAVAEQERALARAIERIRQNLDIETIFQVTTQEVRQILNCDRVVVYRFKADWSGEFMYESMTEGWQSLIVGTGLKVVWEDTYLQETQGGRYANHETCAVNNIYDAGLTDCHIEILEAFQVKAFAVVPVFAGEKLWGLLAAYQNTNPRQWQEREITLLTQVGNQLGVGLNQAELLAQTNAQSSQLRSTLADLNAIVDNLADGLLVTDTRGHITRFNPALKTMFNLEAIELKGTKLADRFPAALSQLVGKTERCEQEIVTGDVELENNRAGQALATSIIKEADGVEGEQCLGSVILIRDVTMEREVDRMKTDFLATVSHELRTPLTSVLGFAAMIQEKLEEVVVPAVQNPDRKTQRALRAVQTNIGIIVSEAERLTALINDVLDIAKMEAGRMEWNLQFADPVGILEQAIAATASLFSKSQLQLIKQFAPALPVVQVDRDRIIQVAINLLSNAVKFTASGSVTCQANIDRNELLIRVIDTGVGIEPDDCKKVFERFKQVGDVLTDKPRGSGLGLPICKQIVEHHGGRIWVESKIGQGSTFSFTLPLGASEDAIEKGTALSFDDVDVIVKQVKEQVASTTSAPEHDRKTILIADDDPNIRELLKQSLEAEAYEVRQATNGKDAIAKAKTLQPDLIVLDVKMPHMNGFDAAAVLKNDPNTMGIPIIMLSIVQDRERGYRIGVDRYLTKPIDRSELLREIDFLLSQGVSAKTVLVVDRDASTLQLLSNALRMQGYSVVAASTGQEGLEKAISVKPDIIIIDSLLSQEPELVKTLRFAKGLENVCLIFLGETVEEKIKN